MYPYLDYACDNYRYAAMQNGRFWSDSGFRRWLAQIKHSSRPPLFLVVPDVPHNARATLQEWQVWEEELRSLKVPLAFAVQNGIQPEQVPASADWIFVGGTDDWRFPRLRELVAMGKPVHVGGSIRSSGYSTVTRQESLVQMEMAGSEGVIIEDQRYTSGIELSDCAEVFVHRGRMSQRAVQDNGVYSYRIQTIA